MGSLQARPGHSGGRRLSWRLGVLAAALPVALVSACTGGSTSGNPAATGATSPVAAGASPTSNIPAPPTSSAPAPAAVITESWKSGTKVSPTSPIKLAVTSGTLTSVKVTNQFGNAVKGTISADSLSWTPAEQLNYNRKYTVVAKAVNADGTATEQKSTFSTSTPNNLTMPYMQRLGGYSITQGATYGVAIVPAIHFDEAIPDKAAATKALKVTTSTPVTGAWYWVDNQDVHYRPKTYWPSGTKVTVSADVYGVDLGNGLYGQANASTSFTIGRKQVTVAYDSAPKVNYVYVYNGAGKVIRKMPTSMGKHGGETVAGHYINFYTDYGTYTVLTHEQPAKMCSASYGLPANAPGGYPCENIYNATKISTDGTYLHELDTTVWAQEHGYDVSHGCLNLNQTNASWYFNHSIIGDPVEIHGTKGAPKLLEWQGGDWTIPWSTWVKGGAVS